MRKQFLILFFLVLIPLTGFSQVEKYKSVFTLNFIRYIGWAEEAKQGDFVIGVLKNSKIADWLTEQSAGKKFGYQNVVIKQFNSVEDVTDCQVLYVSSYINFSRHAETLKGTLGKNSLIITESEGATDHGAVINFVVRDNNLKFEVDEANAQTLGLSISSKLANMAAAIKK
ncbi:YfiR family protein [Plebeiibacterium sediminum]|uniref:YfiR family protein n=1 Tax=Plebeiibacterium sediminum TaxID=2992112 RepID=A0AAE3SDB3_9BACT|nr:YfiR family protein [Plebeiobacterium sediminum]MCW3785143.1 YfiR family protein [Plebeiobacterium sediminum]